MWHIELLVAALGRFSSLLVMVFRDGVIACIIFTSILVPSALFSHQKTN